MIRAQTANISIVLNRPRFPENIGAAARAAKNMGIGQLILVQPQHCDLTRILTLATHVAADLVADMEVHDDLADALGPFNFIVGTTARTGSNRRSLGDPRRVAQELVSISQQNRVALLFGPEDRGLTNDYLKYCQRLVTIPTADFSSLNLAQAVMVLSYEVFRAGLERAPAFVPRLANSFELEGMYQQLSEILTRIQFLNPENPDYWMNNLRQYLIRRQLQARDVKVLRGICRQIDWYCNQLQQKADRRASDDGGLPIGQPDAAAPKQGN